MERPLSADERRDVTLSDCGLFIYTSGTTGLPKAARVSHARIIEWVTWFAGLMQTTTDDRMYDCLPMYHSVGGIVAPGSALVSGGSVVIRGKFSARDFWNDIVSNDCTLFQYIGDLCRYLATSDPIRSNVRIGSAFAVATDYAAMFGRSFSTASRSRGYSSFTRQLKAVSPSTTLKANPAQLADLAA